MYASNASNLPPPVSATAERYMYCRHPRRPRCPLATHQTYRLRSPLLPTATCIQMMPSGSPLDLIAPLRTTSHSLYTLRFGPSFGIYEVVAVVDRKIFKSSTFHFTGFVSFPAVTHNRNTWFDMLQNISHKCSCSTVRYLNKKSGISFPTQSAKHPLFRQNTTNMFLRLHVLLRIISLRAAELDIGKTHNFFCRRQLPNQGSDGNGLTVLSLRSTCQSVTGAQATDCGSRARSACPLPSLLT
ncbi:hypothetical protein J6590_071141 [Homalodisca vitripennis]|nr:hypothetical protein J6590_071141 [Homalodisca vitripennis]